MHPTNDLEFKDLVALYHNIMLKLIPAYDQEAVDMSAVVVQTACEHYALACASSLKSANQINKPSVTHMKKLIMGRLHDAVMKTAEHIENGGGANSPCLPAYADRYFAVVMIGDLCRRGTSDMQIKPAIPVKPFKPPTPVSRRA